MCGRFTLTSPLQQILDLLDVQKLPALEPHYNIAPTQEVVTAHTGEDGREASLMRWGLVPFWADDPKIGSRMINARSETVANKPAFREAFRRRRCLIAADGFIEWQRNGSTRQPYHFQLESKLPFAFAGLWETWEDEEGSELATCTILTTEPNELVAELHDRMPVLLHRPDHDLWLDTTAPFEEVQRLFVPFPAGEMRATAVSTRINSVRNDDPGVLEQAEIQGSLF